MNRRNFIASTAFSTIGCSFCARSNALPTGGGPGDKQNSDGDHAAQPATTTRQSARGGKDYRSQIGCALRAGSEADLRGQFTLSKGSRLPELDRLIFQESEHIARLFGVRPAFLFFDDSKAKNAFATTDNLQQPFTDGSVVFGMSLLEEELSTRTSGIGIIAIMAHEWGHILQFKNGIGVNGKRLELHADLMAGWYVGIKNLARKGDPLVHPGPAWQSITSKGDYQFNSKTHHGTPHERGDAFATGFKQAVSGVDLGTTFNRGRAAFKL